jgi:hypothetical protein
MKRLLVTMTILCAMILSGQAQDKLKIGEVKGGKLVVTNPEALMAYFMRSLNHDGNLGKDYQVSTSPEGDRCVIHYPVLGNSSKVSAIGVMLVKIKNDFCIVENPPETDSSVPGGGGSLEITCTGDNCSACTIDIKWLSGNWMPLVYCKCLSGGGTCDMTIKLVIKVEI